MEEEAEHEEGGEEGGTEGEEGVADRGGGMGARKQQTQLGHVDTDAD